MSLLHHPIRAALKRALRRRPRNGWLQPQIPLPESMRRTAEAADLMAQMREALERPDEQVIFGGVIFVNAASLGAMPTLDEASVHSAPLPPMDFLRWPLSALARLTSRAVRKIASPLSRRQERFNLRLLDAVRHLEARLETQQLECRRLRQRVAELEAVGVTGEREGAGA